MPYWTGIPVCYIVIMSTNAVFMIHISIGQNVILSVILKVAVGLCQHAMSAFWITGDHWWWYW